ncbi:heme NO-binding domain-containing protein [Natrinema halophilum]|uniref:Heme NO-binding domain-containing protein n=1 Tax=Natrinema halophilum TaxID=1699371 RepID=A0A7D5H3H6_9EURY|nr:heme NO-binding domain-containing protein [Natrinema halophilum]QLG49851.1 heme NO-binding domain-containing protein [Natrinema halophilum]
MHGIVHKSLKEYVIERTGDDIWDTVIERSAIEPKLYLPVSYYDDGEIDAVLETLTGIATQNRQAIERDFGRSLAPRLLSTFSAHLRRDWDLTELLDSFEDVYEDVDVATEEATLPELTCTRNGDYAVVSYETHRNQQYCGLAHGILEGIISAYDTEATVTKTACVDHGADACRFRIDLE